MEVITDRKIYNEIWSKVEKSFKFSSSIETNVNPSEFYIYYKCYKLNNVWTEEQEKIINKILSEISNDDIYALDCQHNCFVFNPNEEILFGYHYHNANRDVEVYFPTYYPDSDYHLFISKDFSYGLLGDPWKEEIYVFGNELISKFENKKEELNLTKEEIRLNLNQTCQELIKKFPIYEKRLKNHMKEYNGEILGHVFFGDEFNNGLIDMIKFELGQIAEVILSYTFTDEVINMLREDNQVIKKHCEFIELMWLKGDKHVKNIVDVTILERLSDDVEIWKRFGRYISPKFKRYINEDLLKKNNMMYHVNKL